MKMKNGTIIQSIKNGSIVHWQHINFMVNMIFAEGFDSSPSLRNSPARRMSWVWSSLTTKARLAGECHGRSQLQNVQEKVARASCRPPPPGCGPGTWPDRGRGRRRPAGPIRWGGAGAGNPAGGHPQVAAPGANGVIGDPGAGVEATAGRCRLPWGPPPEILRRPSVPPHHRA